MLAAITHRGPDEGGVDAYGACVLGHRRLRVLDLDTGFQPAENETSDVHVVFNGEIYEFQALREELLAAGHELRGTGDTATLPHLYEEHGPRFAERLHGMFALALWDAPRERLVLARDRIGKKPLLWTQLPDGTLAFASELKALVRLPALRREVDPQALDAFLALQYVPGPGTALEGVHKLPPGHVLVWERGSVTVEEYWRLEPEPAERSDEEWFELVRCVALVAREGLVAAVPAEGDGDVLAGELGDQEHRQRRLVPERLVERPGEPRQQRLRVELDLELLVTRAVAARDRARVRPLVVPRVREADRERAHGLGRGRRHHGDDDARVEAAREERPEGHVRDEPAPDGRGDPLAHELEPLLVAPLGRLGLEPPVLLLSLIHI